MERTLSKNEQIINFPEGPPHPADDHSSQPLPVLTCMANVTAKDVEWVWFQRLAVGKLTVLAGDPGLGKSWLSLFIAAQLSTGGPWPDGGSAPLMNTLLMNAEDALDDTIKPRLMALGADCSRIHALAVSRIGLREKFVQLSDISVIEKAMDETGAGLVVIDPVTAFLGDKTDSYRDSDVRALLRPLANMLEQRGAAGLCVMHLRKGTGQKALHRVAGSIAFGAAARIALGVVEDPNDEDKLRRLLAPMKQNNSSASDALAFWIDQGQLFWAAEPVGQVDIDALMGGAAPKKSDEPREETSTPAERLLREWMADDSRWPMLADDAYQAALAKGISSRTLRRTALEKLGIRHESKGFPARVVWHRPQIGHDEQTGHQQSGHEAGQ